MDAESDVKSWLTAAVFEHACKNDYASIIEKIFKDQGFSKDLYANLTVNAADYDGSKRVKPVFIFLFLLRRLLSSVETFSSDVSSCFPWNSEALPKIIQFLTVTYKQCEYISTKKFFALVTQLKFLDIMHLLRTKTDSSALVQRLNLHFPRWQSSEKAALQKLYSIENPKILDKVEESHIQCRRLILKLAADSTYRALYMSEQFSNDMKKMMIESVIHLKEVIMNLSSNAGFTIIEKGSTLKANESQDLGYQLLLDYIQPEVSPENLLRFLDEMEPALIPPSGGFSSCLLPFDTMSECSDVPMDSECDENESELSSDESLDGKDATLTQSDDEQI